jgi:hypothetical protein
MWREYSWVYSRYSLIRAIRVEKRMEQKQYIIR